LPASEAGDSQLDEVMANDILSLVGPLTRERALEALLAPSTAEGDDAELCLNAHAVDAIDAAGAAATRMRIERHTREHPAGYVSIWLPRHAAVASRFYDILQPLPENVGVGKVPDASPPPHFTLLPATPTRDSEDALLAGGVVLDACLEARIARRRAGYITETTMELVDNALIHGASAPDRPVVAVSSFGRERTVEIAVVDAGTAISEADDPTAVLRTIPGRALAGERGFLGMILSKGASAGVDVQVQILSGTGRLRWTPTQHRTERRRYVPGMTVIARIGA
jgi:anti-sigma regulatory factor (Ser/Thr protein kinase)/ABC-type transporter Mla MlaB component